MLQRSDVTTVVSAVTDAIDFISFLWCVQTFYLQANRRRVVTMPLRSGPAADCSSMCYTLIQNRLQIFIFKRCLFSFCSPYVPRHKRSYSKENAVTLAVTASFFLTNGSANAAT